MHGNNLAIIIKIEEQEKEVITSTTADTGALLTKNTMLPQFYIDDVTITSVENKYTDINNSIMTSQCFN